MRGFRWRFDESFLPAHACRYVIILTKSRHGKPVASSPVRRISSGLCVPNECAVYVYTCNFSVVGYSFGEEEHA